MRQRKRVLVVDDSLTVRELERKLLDRQGYRVEVAVDGMDGWNMLRGSHFDLVITDIDMPRMDGIELVSTIRGDANLRSLPVMVVSYKDREEDRRRGLEAGADYYLYQEQLPGRYARPGGRRPDRRGSVRIGIVNGQADGGGGAAPRPGAGARASGCMDRNQRRRGRSALAPATRRILC